jgi:hypothetical protein
LLEQNKTKTKQNKNKTKTTKTKTVSINQCTLTAMGTLSKSVSPLCSPKSPSSTHRQGCGQPQSQLCAASSPQSARAREIHK